VSSAVTTRRHFALPDLGEGLTEAELAAWHVAVGEVVTLNQVLAEVETEKAIVELPSPFAGTVAELLADAGEIVQVGAALIAIDIDIATTPAAGRDATPGATQAATHAATQGTEEKVPILVGYGPTEVPPSRRRRNGSRRPQTPPASPAATAASPPVSQPLAPPPVRFTARQNGVDLADVTGSGPGGIVTREDLATHLAGIEAEAQARSPAPEGAPRETRAPVRGLQKHMAEAMTRSVATAPQACVFLTVDATPTVDLVANLRRNQRFEGLRVTPLVVVARGVVLALRDHPTLNSSWDETTDEVVVQHDVHLGVAVAGPRGLIVPNIKNAQDLTLRQLTAALSDLTATARAERCTADDLRGGTITLTNVGVFGVDAGVPILNPGEAAILAVGSLQRRPWEFEGHVTLRHLVTLSLSFDHRLVDGQAASLFLRDVGDVLADPCNLIAFA
jgi:2-oxoisovalerate dehydrogenase E2 component (dihydrolipoyl transacylase)